MFAQFSTDDKTSKLQQQPTKKTRGNVKKNNKITTVETRVLRELVPRETADGIHTAVGTVSVKLPLEFGFDTVEAEGNGRREKGIHKQVWPAQITADMSF